MKKIGFDRKKLLSFRQTDVYFSTEIFLVILQVLIGNKLVEHHSSTKCTMLAAKGLNEPEIKQIRTV